MGGKKTRGKRKGNRQALRPGGGLFLFAGMLVIACIVLLLGNKTALPASVSSVSSVSSIEQTSGQTSGQTTGGKLAESPPVTVASQPIAEGEAPFQIRPVDRTPRFDIPPAQGRARLAFVIDDGGQNLETLECYLKVPMPLAIAVMPGLPLTKQSARMVVASGKELMLHQPMQSVNLDLWPGPGAVGPGMSTEQVKALVMANLEELGIGVRGMNNHEGSLITADMARIGAVLDAALDYGVFFMDSRTTSATKAREAARERGMRILERDIFLDNVVEREAMLSQLYEGLELANKNGKAIMIGHVDKSADILPELLTDLAPALEEGGYELVCPSQLMSD